MISYAESEEFTVGDMELLQRATVLVSMLPAKIKTICEAGKFEDRWVRCHELARFVGVVLELDVMDGSYGACEHSWLMTLDGAILDVYTPARVPQVQLAAKAWAGAPIMYRSGPARTDIRKEVIEELRLLWRASCEYQCTCLGLSHYEDCPKWVLPL